MNAEFELPDGSCPISDIQDYFKYILKKHNEKIDNPELHLNLKQAIILSY